MRVGAVFRWFRCASHTGYNSAKPPALKTEMVCVEFSIARFKKFVTAGTLGFGERARPACGFRRPRRNELSNKGA
jgi:hypothetical protein